LLTVRSMLADRSDGVRTEALGRASAPSLATIGPDDDLRSALSHLLRSGTDSLTVVDAEGKNLGQLSFSDMRAAVIEQPVA